MIHLQALIDRITAAKIVSMGSVNPGAPGAFGLASSPFGSGCIAPKASMALLQA